MAHESDELLPHPAVQMLGKVKITFFLFSTDATEEAE